MKHLLAYLIIFSVLFPFSSAQAAAPSDFVSCWDLEEASGDRIDANTTNSNDLADNNTVLSATGKVGTAADFERATTEWLSITDANQVGLEPATALSFFTWVNYESNPSSGQLFGFIGKRNTASTPTYSYESFLQNSGGTQRLRFDVYSGSAEDSFVSNWTPTAGTWYHVGWTWNGSTKTTKFYVNAAQQGADQVGTNVASMQNGTADFMLGRGNSDAHYHDGLFDVSEIYDRVLTTTEISDIYNTGTGVACTARAAAPALPGDIQTYINGILRVNGTLNVGN